MLYLLGQRLTGEYLVLDLSFEVAEAWRMPVSEHVLFEDLSDRITKLFERSEKKIILMIDEVDKSSDNQIFLSFLELLRYKYLEQQENREDTFCSVILVLHPVRSSISGRM